MILYTKLTFSICKRIPITTFNKVYSNEPKSRKVPKKEDPDDDSMNHRLQKSLTHQVLTMPLKKTRLSNPFPEPFKVIPYDVISDMDKARIMQDASRLPHAPGRPKKD